MRPEAIAMALGLAVFAGYPAQAEIPASGEVPLEISARGTVHNPPDDITISVPITATGETAIEARTANQAIIDRLTRDLLAHGLDRAAVRTVPIGMGTFGFVGNEMVDPDNPVTPALAGAAKHKTASSMLQIKLKEQAKIDMVRLVLDADDQAMAGPPQLALTDDTAARRTAVAAAIAKARADADIYAASLGMKVSRITRVSNRAPNDSAEGYTMMADVMAMAQSQGGNDVATNATVWIDFVMVPR